MTDTTTPTRSMAFDIAANAWSAEILDAVEVPAELFDTPALLPWEPCGVLSSEWAETLGLDPGVIVAAGGADDQAAALGGGAANPGNICLGTGTCSDWRLVLADYEPDLSGAGDTAPHVVPDHYIREVTIDSAGSSLRWFRDALCRDLSPGYGFEQIIELAMDAPRGAAGVRFFPFVDGGQRAPYYLDTASGIFFGITSHHTRAHLARAVIEGIAFLYPRTWQLLVEGSSAGVPTRRSPEPLTMVDGEAASMPWTRLKADVLGHPIRVTRVTEAAAMGAAILAATSAGLFASPADAAASMVKFGAIVEPDETAHSIYTSIREEYEVTFEQMAPAFAQQTGGRS